MSQSPTDVNHNALESYPWYYGEIDRSEVGSSKTDNHHQSCNATHLWGSTMGKLRQKIKRLEGEREAIIDHSADVPGDATSLSYF